MYRNFETMTDSTKKAIDYAQIKDIFNPREQQTATYDFHIPGSDSDELKNFIT